MRRAGLDYWEKLAPAHYQDWEDFLARNPARRLWFLSTKGDRFHTQARYQPGDGLVVGRETKGLPREMLDQYADQVVKIPMPGDFHRSLNQAQAAAVVLYEALRQINGW